MYGDAEVYMEALLLRDKTILRGLVFHHVTYLVDLKILLLVMGFVEYFTLEYYFY